VHRSVLFQASDQGIIVGVSRLQFLVFVILVVVVAIVAVRAIQCSARNDLHCVCGIESRLIHITGDPAVATRFAHLIHLAAFAATAAHNAQQ
jgi:hypothetical protein